MADKVMIHKQTHSPRGRRLKHLPGAAAGDEVEDLYELLKDVKTRFPAVEAVSSGAIYSTYQRTRVEDVCARLGLRSMSYLWRRDQRKLLKDMGESKLRAVVVKTASMGL